MCGFVGVVGSDRSSPRLSKEQVSAISHRGPDESREISWEDGHICFARLSIIDLAHGSQPFVDESSGLVSMTNGEIYNYRELRRKLELAGAAFSSNSDAEVVLWGWKQWGTELFAKLKGMFAIALIDIENGLVILARDRLGKKPLYYFASDKEFHFGSEVPALGGKAPIPIPRLLGSYLLTDALTWDAGAEEGIQQVEAGTYFSVGRNGAIEKSRFWAATDIIQRRVSNRGWTKKTAFERLRLSFEKSIENRLISDVPVGLFLSSGRDSKLVAAAAAQVGEISQAYTLQFESSSFDESEDAKSFAESLRIPHVMVDASLDSLAEIWEEFKTGVDEPFADSAILGQMLLARRAAGSTKVVLTGDGGDELFLGYQHILAHKVVQNSALRAPALGTAKLLTRFASERGEKYFSLSFVLRRFLRASGNGSLYERDLAWRAAFDPSAIPNVFSSEIVREFSESQRRLVEKLSHDHLGFDWRDKWTLFYLDTYLKDVILRKVDRATMRFGVEARSPLLDSDFVEQALSLSPLSRGGLLNNKPPISFLAHSYLQGHQIARFKHGMGVPLASLLAGPLRADVYRYLDLSRLLETGLYREEGLRGLLTEFSEAPWRRSREIWSVLVFEVWRQKMGVKIG